ncbi:hypothetical protein BDW66DRAFT_154257 [Aspergillus desertorum]
MGGAAPTATSDELFKATALLSPATPDARKGLLETTASFGDGNKAKGVPPTESRTNEPQGTPRNAGDTRAQEIKITRAPPENWRAAKRLRRIDPEQSILLTTSKGSSSLVLRAKPSEKDHQYAPYRLAINSRYLLNVLESCTETLFTEEQNVLVRPFKYLVEFESESKDLLRSTEASCKQAEEEMNRSAAPAKQEDIERTKAMAVQLKRERDELRCLVEFMDHDMTDIFDIKRATLENTLDEIAFEHLWQLYQPVDVIYRTFQNFDSRRQAYRVLHVTGGRVCFDTKKRSYFDPVNDRVWDSESEDERKCRDASRRSGVQMTNLIIDCFHLESDGIRLAPRPKRFAITPYSGTRSVASLPLRPLQFDPQKKTLEKQLVARGARFMQVAQGKHMEYHGNTIEESKIATIAEKAEKILDSFCKLAHRWRCVLLLDEADVFLAKRERGDIARNIFLRVLEYFPGVIILTTNHVGEFDEAFRSRIHVCLYYPKLEKRETKEIWEKNIQRIKETKSGTTDATLEWPPDQEHLSTAITLANWEFYDEKNVAQITAHFDDYISDIYGTLDEDTYAFLAARDALRVDENSAMFASRSRMQETSRVSKSGIVRQGGVKVGITLTPNTCI